MRYATRRSHARLVLAMLALPGVIEARDALVSDLRWSADGGTITCRAGAGAHTRRLVLDAATGGAACPTPELRDPSWSEARRSVLFRDLFGIYEVEAGGSVGSARQVLFLPESSPHFLRALGSDARGRILAWTYDRRQARHEIWSLESGVVDSTVYAAGPEALLAWRRRNEAVAFDAVPNRFVRTACIRRSSGEARLCAEIVPDGTRTPTFRVTLGPPGGIDVLTTHCVPTAMAPSPDSSRIVLGLLERVRDGRSALASAWLVTWSGGRRAYELPLDPPADVRVLGGAWVRWLPGDRALWAESHTGLWMLDGSTGRPLVAAPRDAAHGALACVVVDRTGDRHDAAAIARRLRDAGFEGGWLQHDSGYEIQAGASAERASLEARAARLRQQGWAGARVEDRAVEAIAPGIAYGHASGPAGKLAWSRIVERDGERASEIWVQAGDEAPRRLLSLLGDTGTGSGR